MRLPIFAAFLLSVNLVEFTKACEIEDACSISGDETGVVKLDRDCEEFVRFSRDKQRTSRCGFHGKSSLVCCSISGTRLGATENAETACKRFGTPPPNFSTTFKILGGTDAELAEFPYFAQIGYSFEDEAEIKFDCGGALISEKFVLSAAHCFAKRNLPATLVRLGRVNF